MSRDPSLIWRCRRGIREMDLLLQRFVELRYDNMTEKELKIFEELLEYPDLDILDWIMQRKMPPTESIKSMVQQIRNTDNHQTDNL